jgi:SH3 domain protein
MPRLRNQFAPSPKWPSYQAEFVDKMTRHSTTKAEEPVLIKTLLLILFVCIPNLLQAALQKGYITDKLEVQLRSGPSLQRKITKMLVAGTPITVLSQSDDNNYTLVKLEDGDKGWILARYVSPDPAARTVLDDTIRKLEAATEENKRLKEEVAALKLGKDGTDKTTQQLQAEKDRLETELKAVRFASANALKIQDERDKLQESVVNLERELESIRRDKQALDADYSQNWFLSGAGVLLGGILLGWILPRLSWRKKSDWSSF